MYPQSRNNVINKQVRKYGYTFCQHCNASNAYKFHVHHIVFRSEASGHKELHNERNLIIVCDVCHGKFHANKSLRNNLVKERELEELFNLKLIRY